jgi:hypothetical protein
MEHNDAYFFRHSFIEKDNDIEAQEEVVIVPHATYETLVAALVHTHYSADAETAIIANYLADPDNADHRAEFEQYQAWRAEVKTACKEYFNID